MSHGVRGSNTAAFHQLRQNAADACRVATRREQLELVAGLAEAYGECEDLPGFDGEHEVRICENSLFVFIVEVKIPVAYLVWPASIPLGRPQRGYAFERVLVGDPHSVALNHQVESFFLVAAGRQNDVRVSTQVDRLLCGVGSGKVDGPVVPDGNARRDVRATVGPHGCEPEQLGGFQHPARLLPWRDPSAWDAVSGVECGDGFVHPQNS